MDIKVNQFESESTPYCYEENSQFISFADNMQKENWSDDRRPSSF